MNRRDIGKRHQEAIDAVRKGLGYRQAADVAELPQVYVSRCIWAVEDWLASGAKGVLNRTDIQFGVDMKKAHAHWLQNLGNTVADMQYLKTGLTERWWEVDPPEGGNIHRWNRYAEGLDIETREEYERRVDDTLHRLRDPARSIWMKELGHPEGQTHTGT